MDPAMLGNVKPERDLAQPKTILKVKMENLEQALVKTDNTLQKLEERLRPYMRPKTPTPADPDNDIEKAQMSSDFITEIRIVEHAVEDFTDRINDILDHLDI